MQLMTLQKAVDKIRAYDPNTAVNFSMLSRLVGDGMIPYEKHGNRTIIDYDRLVVRLKDMLFLSRRDPINPPHIRSISDAFDEAKSEINRLGVGRERLRELVNCGKVPSLHIGNRRYIALEVFRAPDNSVLFSGTYTKEDRPARRRGMTYADELMDDLLKRGARQAPVKRV